MELLAARYAAGGYVAGGRQSTDSLAEDVGRADFAEALDTLAVVQAVVVGPQTVVLSPTMKIELMRLPIVRVWWRGIEQLAAAAHRQDMVRAAREELGALVEWARVQLRHLPPVTQEYAACLAGVLAVPDLQPEAFTAVHWHFGEPADKLHFLRSPAATRLGEPVLLLRHLLRAVPQDYAAPWRAATGAPGSLALATEAEEAAASRLIAELTGTERRTVVPAPRRERIATPVVAHRAPPRGAPAGRSELHVCTPACRTRHP